MACLNTRLPGSLSAKKAKNKENLEKRATYNGVIFNVIKSSFRKFPSGATFSK